MKKLNENKHYVLGFERRNSGAFEHSWGLGQNLKNNNLDVEYLAHWWGSPIKNVNLRTERTNEIDIKDIKKKKGVFHLQTHTWEYEGLLKDIAQTPESKMIYNLHAIIPYFYLNVEDKDRFLEGKLSVEEMMIRVDPRMNSREKAQLSAIKKADYLFTISQSHKTILERMRVNKPIYIFENVSDFNSIEKDTLNAAKISGSRFRDNLNVDNVLLYCGNLSYGKGSFGLFDAFKEIRKTYSSSKLVLLGSGEDRKEYLFSAGLHKNDLENIVLIPWINKNAPEGQSEFLKYYYAADVLVQPMITEGLFAKTVIDAMNMGLPTITCKSPYSIGTSRTKDEIVNSFMYMKDNPKEVESLIKSAKEKVKKENTWDSYISRMNKIILR